MFKKLLNKFQTMLIELEVYNLSDKIIPIPINLKILLTIKEAAELFNIGENKIKELTNDNDCKFVLWNGSKRLIKRKAFEDYLLRQYSI